MIEPLVKDKMRLARYIFCAFVAETQGISVRAAERRLERYMPDQETPSWCCHHLAEYMSRLTEGYLPLNLDDMVNPEDRWEITSLRIQ